MEKTFMVKNDNKFRVGIRYKDGSNRELTFQSGQIIPMKEIDIMNVDATSRLFKSGTLAIIRSKDEDIELLGIDPNNPNAIKEDKIKDILSKAPSTYKNAFKGVKEKHAIDRIINVVESDGDLSATKIRTIEKIFGVEINTDPDNQEV